MGTIYSREDGDDSMNYKSIIEMIESAPFSENSCIKLNQNGTATIYRKYDDCCTAQTLIGDGWCGIVTHYPDGNESIMFKQFLKPYAE